MASAVIVCIFDSFPGRPDVKWTRWSAAARRVWAVDEAFDWQVLSDRAEGRVTISATITEAVAAFAGTDSGGGRIRTCEG